MKRILNIKSHYQWVKALYARYERWLMPATLVVGFLVDYFTFTSIQIGVTLAILFGYWVLAGATIIFMNFYDADKLSNRLRYVRLLAPLLIQFTFGALLGASMVFYWFSGTFSVSWPIILIVVVLMVFNDIFRHYFLKPEVQLGVYFFITFSLFSLILPFLFKSLSPWLFVLGGGASIAVFYPYISFLPLVGENTKQKKQHIFAVIIVILVAMNILYFANVIPPIPLSLREAGLYHSLKVSDGKYNMQGEPETFFDTLIPGQVLHARSGEKIYLYTAIFAPAKLETQIIHHWQYYDEAKKRWISQEKLPFMIFGGRKEGYKGYSYKSDLMPGSWRIFVENERGQVLGRIKFYVEKVQGKIDLQEVTR